MLTLRLTERAEAREEHHVEITLEGAGARRTASTRFPFSLSDDDRDRVQWYLEDYVEYPLNPAPAIAEAVTNRLAEIGRELFEAIFHATDDARDIWAAIRGRLPYTRVEVAADFESAITMPWELLRDPKTDGALALRARAFVRTQHATAQPVDVPKAMSDQLRVLLVICRPAGDRDVPFRSVAAHLVRMSVSAGEALDLDVLRPPSFAELGRVLRNAMENGRPYHVVHFDGHGVYADGRAVSRAGEYSCVSPPRDGDHGYLVFEDPAVSRNAQLVDGPVIGSLLADCDVQVLVLNACRSAHAEAPAVPASGDPLVRDVHGRVRAYGSLAQEVVDAGVPGVVAMRYNVLVVTAARFIAELYTALLEGYELGAAVGRGRISLADDPYRTIGFDPMPIQDWMVPIVYEAEPLTLARRRQQNDEPLRLRLDGASEPVAGTLPAPPDVGFYGRDETLLALERALNRHPVVLLHAYAGSGKTTTAVEFARWYQLTGGLAAPGVGDGRVLFTSFEYHTPLARALDDAGVAFQDALTHAGVEWYALTDDRKRRDVILQVLRQVPVVWIWDNVEPVAGFPAGAASAWSAEEQAELREFLRALRETRAKIVLTSRREEREWLGDLPVRVGLPPMPMRESVQLARAIVERQPPHRLTDVEDWRPLLRFAAGNPLTITALVGQALREGLTTRAEIDAFVGRLRSGEAAVADDEREGRSKSLAASLGYGFASAFSEPERQQLAVLREFQGFVDADALVMLGRGDPSVPAFDGVHRDQAAALLRRASELGLLEAVGDVYFEIHPALPWYFDSLFHEVYGDDPEIEARVRLAYCHAIATLGGYWQSRFVKGTMGSVAPLKREEMNLLRAFRIAIDNRRWSALGGCLDALDLLYTRTGRARERRRLLEQTAPHVADPETDGPLPGREELWRFYTASRVDIAVADRDWRTAERLQGMVIEVMRETAADALSMPAEQLSSNQRDHIRTLAVAVEGLGHALFEQRDPRCIQHLEEALALFNRLGLPFEQSNVTLTLGNAYRGIPELRDLDKAEAWYRRGLSLIIANSRGRAMLLGSLGGVHRERFSEAVIRREPPEVLEEHLRQAFEAYDEAADGIPPDDLDLQAAHWDQVGTLHLAAGDAEAGLRAWHRSLVADENAENRYGAGVSRSKIADLLEAIGRQEDALKYARAARADVASYGGGSEPLVRAIDEQISRLEARLRDQPEPPAA